MKQYKKLGMLEICQTLSSGHLFARKRLKATSERTGEGKLKTFQGPLPAPGCLICAIFAFHANPESRLKVVMKQYKKLDMLTRAREKKRAKEGKSESMAT